MLQILSYYLKIIILPKNVSFPKNRTVEKWTKSDNFATVKTERDEEVKTFRQREGKGCQIIGKRGDGGNHHRRLEVVGQVPQSDKVGDKEIAYVILNHEPNI